jgi:hypothetical protein
MEFVYIMINSIDLTEKEAIDSSISYLNIRIEILDIGYLSTYNYYKNGKLYKYYNK